MDYKKIENIISMILEHESDVFEKPQKDDWEMQSGRWNKNMIPFYGIGNGDYFCLCSKEGKKSKVYYYYEDKSLFEPYTDSFEEWIEQLHDFLG